MKIGLTMSVTWTMDRDEPRDTLSRAWHGLFSRIMPDALCVPIPNLGVGRAGSFVQALELDGIIFTGSGTLGQDPLRDETELDLLETAIKLRLPVFGAGRGLLLMQTRFGGNLEPVNGHQRREHEVALSNLPFCRHQFRNIYTNSDHKAGIVKLAPGLLPFAVDKKDRVEGAYHEAHRLVGVMWHPEQPGAPEEFDSTLLRSLFKYPN